MNRVLFVFMIFGCTMCFGQITMIGDDNLSAFGKCMDGDNDTLTLEDEYNYPDFKAGKLYYRILSNYSDTIVEVYDSFCRCDIDENLSQLDTCIIPDRVIYEGKIYTVKGIGYGVFQTCPKLKKVVLPNTITYIAHGNFMYCDSLMSINIPPSVKRVGPPNFGMNSYVESVYRSLPDTIEYVRLADINPW